MELSDDPFDGHRLSVPQAPVLVTLSRIGTHCIIDPTPEEEACVLAGVVIGVTPEGQVTMVRKTGSGGIRSELLGNAIKLGQEMGVKINAELSKKLMQEEEENRKSKKEKLGLLG